MYNNVIENYNSQGIAYYRNQEYDSAASYFRIVLQKAQNENNNYFIAMANYNLAFTYEKIGKNYSNLGRFYDASNYYRVALIHAKNCKNVIVDENMTKNINELEQRLKAYQPTQL